ncbi:L,D-transpeptidase [Cognatishimia activa]|uniref:Putative L,D-transpeptidase YbiS n=1 Tax=Cognatishimia activa TaxID=1715691 RepID=A0A0P1IVC7_9RHOB|nr:L,D-transpeptidase [Cognatishimia activa]CUJ18195.1 putative L,D-transpeptidase YbiS precursor [Cognatishimia activa]CUK27590.1 putative L,D-transpeptidase YbiS precursor [Cognatishimia activa]
MTRISRRTFTAALGAATLVGGQGHAEMKKIPRSHGPTTMEIVSYRSNERPGTIIISNQQLTLHRVLGKGQAEKYKISAGRDGFVWVGTTVVGRKATWPAWRPPAAMRKRDTSLPDYVPPGPYNPLGARALYLFEDGRDTLYRIHGTNSSSTIGGYETSGCFRLTNADVMSLYEKVKPGTKVIVK